MLASASVVQVPVVLGQELCSASQGVCGGVSARMLSGACTDLFFVCEDGDAGTVSSCLPDTSSCSHEVPAESDAPKCFTECAPDCENKACGEDGCGGFCAVCGVGQGCSNYECVIGQSDGSCDAPLNLGNTNTTTAPVIETDDRVTIMTVGDTTQALHFETPSCNTLTASPELVFFFVVPDGKTYGYDMQLSGYDTVIQLMKVRIALSYYVVSCRVLYLDHVLYYDRYAAPSVYILYLTTNPRTLYIRINAHLRETRVFLLKTKFSTVTMTAHHREI
jgi:hypothetical protein